MPTTEAGKRLLAEFTDSIDAGGGLHLAGADIVEIEDEAAAAERERIKREVKGLEHSPCVAFDYAEVLDRAAVLRIIDGVDAEA